MKNWSPSIHINQTRFFYYNVHRPKSLINNHFAGLFDWENAVIYDPLCEIATAPTWTSHYPKADALKKGFLQELGFTPDNFDNKLTAHFMRKMLDKIQFALRGERLADKHINFFNEGCKRANLEIKINLEV